MNKLSSSDRSALIRLASSLPAGSSERKAILAGLSKTSSFPFKVGDVITPSLSGKIGNSPWIYHKGRGYTVKGVEDSFGTVTVTLEDPSGRSDKILQFPTTIFHLL